jgi:hypothetical protein
MRRKGHERRGETNERDRTHKHRLLAYPVTDPHPERPGRGREERRDTNCKPRPGRRLGEITINECVDIEGKDRHYEEKAD